MKIELRTSAGLFSIWHAFGLWHWQSPDGSFGTEDTLEDALDAMKDQPAQPLPILCDYCGAELLETNQTTCDVCGYPVKTYEP